MRQTGAMGCLDRLFGREPAPPQRPPARAPAPARAPVSDDQQALERYRYLVRTAPPGRIEDAHREAFERLTPQQRQLALE